MKENFIEKEEDEIIIEHSKTQGFFFGIMGLLLVPVYLNLSKKPLLKHFWSYPVVGGISYTIGYNLPNFSNMRKPLKKKISSNIFFF